MRQNRSKIMPTLMTMLSLVLCAADKPPAPIRLRIGTLPYMSNAILKIAETGGFFAEQGLEVELIQFRSSNDLMPLLLKGDLDAGTPALTAGFFNAIARGGRVKVALPLTAFTRQEGTVAALLARRRDVESGRYSDPARWKGATIGIPLAGALGLPGYIVDLILRREGSGVKDVTLTPLDPAVQGEVLGSGQIDLLFAVEPWVTRLVAGGGVMAIARAEDAAPDLTSSFIAFGRTLLDRPEVGRRFAAAYLAAVRRYREGKTARNVEIVAKFSGLDAELVRKACWSDIPLDGAVNEDSIMAYQEWLQRLGLLDRLLPAEEYRVTGLVRTAR